MADKKTSQETSGAPIQGADLWRIARSGGNYKLTSEELFTESITKADLATKATANGLIPGRYYFVTDTSEGTAMVQAQTVSTFSNIAITSSSNRTQLNQFTALGITNGYIDNNANYFLGADWGAQYYERNISNTVGYADFTGSTVHSNEFLGGTYVIINSDVQYNRFENVTIITDGSPCTIGVCNLRNCTINLNNGAALSYMTIDGTAVSGVTYTFDGVGVIGGVIISGEYSTVQYDLNMSTYYAGNTITTPANTDYVGQFNLKNASGGENIRYIDIATNGNSNIHTPVRFQNCDNSVILTTHINKPSQQNNPFEIMFPKHHGNANDLHTKYSYIEGKLDGMSLLWVITEYNDYD